MAKKGPPHKFGSQTFFGVTGDQMQGIGEGIGLPECSVRISCFLVKFSWIISLNPHCVGTFYQIGLSFDTFVVY